MSRSSALTPPQTNTALPLLVSSGPSPPGEGNIQSNRVEQIVVQQGQVLLERGNIQSNRVEQFALNCCTSKIWITCSDKHIPGEHPAVGKGCSPLEREWLGEKSNVLPAIATVAIFAIFKVFLSVEKYLSSTTSELREPCQIGDQKIDQIGASKEC